MKFWSQPIRVFCFHHVSDVFDAESMWECDWMSTNDFKTQIESLQKEYTFISLSEARDKLKYDIIRRKKHAVLTADDGWSSIMNVLPWLTEQNIPITLFINPLYLDGIHKQEREAERLLTKEELNKIVQAYPNVSIASHGWSHIDTTKLDVKEFENNMLKAEDVLSQLSCKVPFYAFTYGKSKKEHIGILHKHHLIPVLIDGNVNTRFDGLIHRETLDKSE